MTKDVTWENFSKFISSNFNKFGANVARESKLQADLGLDSVQSILLAIDAEEEFAIKLPDGFEKFPETVGDMFDFLQNLPQLTQQ